MTADVGLTEQLASNGGAIVVTVADFMPLGLPAPVQLTSYHDVPMADGVTETVPLVAPPVLIELLVQDVAFVEDQLMDVLFPITTVDGFAVSVAVTGGLLQVGSGTQLP